MTPRPPEVPVTTMTIPEVRRLANVLSARASALGAQLALADDIHTGLLQTGASPDKVTDAWNVLHRLEIELTLALQGEDAAFEALAAMEAEEFEASWTDTRAFTALRALA